MKRPLNTVADPGGGRIDWALLRGRLDEVAERMTRPAVSAADRLRILRERARIAALEWLPGPAAAERLQTVEFLLAYERYAIETRRVVEVLALRDLTPLPGAPAFVAGLVNARGRVVSVVDLKVFFDLPAKGLPDLNRVIVIGDDAMEFGLLVDSVSGITDVMASALQPALPTQTGIREAYLRGLTADRLAVLDADRILADPRIVVRQAPSAATPNEFGNGDPA